MSKIGIGGPSPATKLDIRGMPQHKMNGFREILLRIFVWHLRRWKVSFTVGYSDIVYVEGSPWGTIGLDSDPKHRINVRGKLIIKGNGNIGIQG